MQVTRINCCILHKRDRLGIARLRQGQSQCRAAQAPDAPQLSRIGGPVHVVAEPRFAQRGLHAIEPFGQAVAVVIKSLPGHFDDQNRAGVADDKIPQGFILDLAASRVQDTFVDELQGRRLVFENVRCGRHGLQNRVKLHHGDFARLGQRHQTQLRLQRQSQSAFRAHQHLSHIEGLTVFHKPVQVIATHPAHNFRIAFINFLCVLSRQLRHHPVTLAFQVILLGLGGPRRIAQGVHRHDAAVG